MPPNPDPEADGGPALPQCGPALPQAPPSRFSTALATALPSRFSTVSYNVYNTVTSVSSDSSYNAYDTMSSTATDMTGVGESMEELHLTVAGLETHRQDAGAHKKQEIASLDFSTKNSDYSPQNGGVLADWRSDPCGKAGKYGRRKLPILGWLPQYCTDWAVADMIAGVTVGLTIIPQGIAYANIAGLPPQYGLYSSIMGCFAYIVFGSEKDINIGPTAIMALMTKKISIYGPEYAVLLTLLSGVIILAAGLLKLGFLIDFISLPVTAGFCSAAAVTIASSQLRSLLGVAVDPKHKSHTHAGVVDYYIDLVQNRDSLRWQDATLGLTCATIILTLRAVNRAGWFHPLGSGGSDGWVRRLANRLNTRALAVLDKVVWFVCTARNAIVVIFCLGLAAVMDPDIEACMEDRDNCTFTLTGNIQSGLPTFQSPPFSLAGNLTTTGEPVSFPAMVGKLGISIIIVPIVAIVDAVAIAKAFAGGRPVDASQEMVSVGVANILGSFVGAMPTTHSLSRAAVNSASGVRTPMGGGYTGALVLLCLAFLMPYCAFIPKATLAAVIVCAILFSVEHHIVKPMWEASRLDLVPGFISFFVGVFYELEMGIFSGMGVHIAIVLYNTARPNVAVEIRQVSGQHYLSVTPDQGISFPSVSYLRSLVSKAGIRQGQSSLPVVIQCEHISSVDFTAASSFKAMLEDFTSRDQAVYWHNPGERLAATLTSAVGESFRVITAPEDILSDCVENSLRRCRHAGKETPWSQEQQDKEEQEQQKKQEDHKLSMEP